MRYTRKNKDNRVVWKRTLQLAYNKWLEKEVKKMCKRIDAYRRSMEPLDIDKLLRLHRERELRERRLRDVEIFFNIYPD